MCREFARTICNDGGYAPVLIGRVFGIKHSQQIHPFHLGCCRLVILDRTHANTRSSCMFQTLMCHKCALNTGKQYCCAGVTEDKVAINSVINTIQTRGKTWTGHKHEHDFAVDLSETKATHTGTSERYTSVLPTPAKTLDTTNVHVSSFTTNIKKGEAINTTNVQVSTFIDTTHALPFPSRRASYDSVTVDFTITGIRNFLSKSQLNSALRKQDLRQVRTVQKHCPY